MYRDVAEAVPNLARKLSEGEQAQFADRLTPLLLLDDHGLIDSVIRAALPVISSAAAGRLDAALAAAAQEVGSPRNGEEDWERRFRVERVTRARQVIADQRGDVDAFIALASSHPSRLQDTVGIAERLLAAGRASEEPGAPF